MASKLPADAAKRRLLLIGGGGHCRSVLDAVLATGEYAELGIIDREDVSTMGVGTIGADEDIPVLFRAGWTEACITVGSTGDTRLRRRLYRLAKDIGLRLPAIVDPTAVLARDAVLGEGTFVGKRAVVNSGAMVGACAIINSGAIVEHDCRLEDFVHISPGAILCGQVSVGADSHIGAGSVLRQLVSVGRGTLIGQGSVVLKHIPDNVVAFGNPCKVVRER